MNLKGDNVLQVGAAPIETFNIRIVGHENISKKMFDIVNHLLLEYEIVEYEALNEIVFSPDEPEGFGGFDPGDKKVTINLGKHLESAIEMCKDPTLSNLSLRSHLWFGMLTTINHEMIHAMEFAIDPEKMLDGNKDAIEEAVSKETAARLADLIRDYDVEPADMKDEPFFGSRFMEFYVKNIKENSEQWAIDQNAVYDSGIIWKDGDLTCTTFREWYRSAYNHGKNNKWDKDPTPLKAAEVVDEEPDTGDSPDVAELIAKSAAPLPVVVEETPKATAEPAEPAELPSIPEGLDPETLALLDIEEIPEFNMEDPVAYTPTPPAPEGVKLFGNHVETGSPVVPPVQTQATDPTALPAKTPVQATICKGCNTVLATGAKFCSNCGTSIVETPEPNWSTQTVQQPVGALPTAPVLPTPGAPTHFSSGAKRAMRHDLPNYNHSPEQIRACVGEVLGRCYQHIFGKCGWSPGQNPSFAVEIRGAVQEPISVVGIPCIDQILIGMDSVDHLTGNFTWSVPPVNGMIRGKITKNAGAPSYTLYFNFNGHEAKRLIIPQNQWKITGENYTGPAQRAQQGAMIVWMMDGDDSTPGKKWRAKIENGTLEWLI